MGEVKARMGLVRGQVLAGNVGSSQRMKYGLVGDSVNLASRLEGLCKKYKTQALIDGAARDAPGVVEEFLLRPVDLVTVKGRNGHTELYELVAMRAQVQGTSLEGMYTKFCEDFAEIHALYRRREFKKALEHLEEYRLLWPSDEPARLFHQRCVAMLAEPPGESWSPVAHLGEK